MPDDAGMGLITAIVNAMGADSSVFGDPEQLDRLVTAYNALPLEQRRAITDSMLLAHAGELEPDADEDLGFDADEDFDLDADPTGLPSIGPGRHTGTTFDRSSR